MRGERRRAWVKLWVTGWLHGSIRWQLDPAERGVWADLICLAGQCNQGGAIGDNDGRPFPLEYLANQLNIPIELFGQVVAKCKREGRLEDKDGVLKIANWDTYQSEYERLKPYREYKKLGEGKFDKGYVETMSTEGIQYTLAQPDILPSNRKRLEAELEKREKTEKEG